MVRIPALALLAVTAALATAAVGTTAGAVVPSHHVVSDDRGGPGKWTKVSTGTVQSIFEASMVRSPDGVLHIVYPKNVAGGMQLGHTAVHTDGSLARQNDVLPAPWVNVDRRPVVTSTSAGLRVVFTGLSTSAGSGFWDHGRMYTATADAAGAAWALPAEAVGISDQAAATYGTGGTTLPDGVTPVAAFATGDTSLIWHVGTGEAQPDAAYTSPSCCIFDTTLVRDGDAIWAGWYENGSTAATNGTFAMQIWPTVGTPQKAPGSSVGASSHTTGRVALAARKGGGVYAAYCAGPLVPCDAVRVWKVGTTQTKNAPHSKGATSMSLSAGPSGRLWVSWSDTAPQVRAVRTGVNGLAMGAVVTVGRPSGANQITALSVEGSRGRGDLVVNVGDSFWHTQVLPGLTLHASPSRWRHGSKQKVEFTVTDAQDAVKGSEVKVGKDRCTTDKHGTCTITFPASTGKGRYTATAARRAYARATTGLKVR